MENVRAAPLVKFFGGGVFWKDVLEMFRKMFWKCSERCFGNFSKDVLEIFASSARRVWEPLWLGGFIPGRFGIPGGWGGDKSPMVVIGQIYTTYLCGRSSMNTFRPYNRKLHEVPTLVG